MKLFVLIGGSNHFVRDLLDVWRELHEVRVFHRHKDTTQVGFLGRKWRATQNIRSIKRNEVRRNYEWSDITFVEWAGYAARYLTNRVKGTVPIITRVPGIPRGPNARHFKKIAFGNVAKIIVLTETMQCQLLHSYPSLAEKTVVIPEAVRQSFFALKLTGRQTQKMAVVARLIPPKRIELVLQAVSTPLHEHTGLTLHIAGEGSERKRLQQLAKDLQIHEKVQFEGYIPNTMLPMWLADKDLIFNASDREGFPSSLLEAMASGVVPLIRGWKGARGVFSPSFIKPYDEKRFIKQTERFIQDFYNKFTDEDRVSLKTVAYDWAYDFRLENAVERYETLFQHVLGG